jgi:hypothetical protein
MTTLDRLSAWSKTIVRPFRHIIIERDATRLARAERALEFWRANARGAIDETGRELSATDLLETYVTKSGVEYASERVIAGLIGTTTEKWFSPGSKQSPELFIMMGRLLLAILRDMHRLYLQRKEARVDTQEHLDLARTFYVWSAAYFLGLRTMPLTEFNEVTLNALLAINEEFRALGYTSFNGEELHAAAEKMKNQEDPVAVALRTQRESSAPPSSTEQALAEVAAEEIRAVAEQLVVLYHKSDDQRIDAIASLEGYSASLHTPESPVPELRVMLARFSESILLAMRLVPRHVTAEWTATLDKLRTVDIELERLELKVNRAFALRYDITTQIESLDPTLASYRDEIARLELQRARVDVYLDGLRPRTDKLNETKTELEAKITQLREQIGTGNITRLEVMDMYMQRLVSSAQPLAQLLATYVNTQWRGRAGLRNQTQSWLKLMRVTPERPDVIPHEVMRWSLRFILDHMFVRLPLARLANLQKPRPDYREGSEFDLLLRCVFGIEVCWSFFYVLIGAFAEDALAPLLYSLAAGYLYVLARTAYRTGLLIGFLRFPRAQREKLAAQIDGVMRSIDSLIQARPRLVAMLSDPDSGHIFHRYTDAALSALSSYLDSGGRPGDEPQKGEPESVDPFLHAGLRFLRDQRDGYDEEIAAERRLVQGPPDFMDLDVVPDVPTEEGDARRKREHETEEERGGGGGGKRPRLQVCSFCQRRIAQVVFVGSRSGQQRYSCDELRCHPGVF